MTNNKRVAILKRIALRSERVELPPDNKLLLEKAANPATIMGKSMGLEYLGFGYWGRNHIATHKENEDRTWLEPLEKKQKIIKSHKLKKLNIDFATNYDQEAPKHKFSSDLNYTSKVKTGVGSMATPHSKWDSETQSYKQVPSEALKYSSLNRFDLPKLIADSHEQYEKLKPNEKTALRRYTEDLYGPLNGALRRMARIVSGEGRGDQFNSERIEFAGDMDDAFKKLRLPQELVVYRGASPEEVEKFAKGKVIDVQQYLSTSISAPRAYTFNTGQHLLAIRVPKGHRGIFAAGISSYEGENEVILDRGMQLKVVRIEAKIPGGMKGDIAADAIKKLRRQHDDLNYMPSRDEVVEELARSNDVYQGLKFTHVMEIVGNKKLISKAELDDPLKFIKKHIPERFAALEAEKKEEEKRMKKELAQQKKEQKEKAEALAKKKAALKALGLLYEPVQLPKDFGVHEVGEDDKENLTDIDYENFIALKIEPNDKKPLIIFNPTENPDYSPNMGRKALYTVNGLSYYSDTEESLSHGFIPVYAINHYDENGVKHPALEIYLTPTDNLTTDDSENFYNAAHRLAKITNKVVKVMDDFNNRMVYIRPDGKTNTPDEEDADPYK